MLFLSWDLVFVWWWNCFFTEYPVVLCLSVISSAEPILESRPVIQDAVTFQPAHQSDRISSSRRYSNTANTHPNTHHCFPIHDWEVQHLRWNIGYNVIQWFSQSKAMKRVLSCSMINSRRMSSGLKQCIGCLNNSGFPSIKTNIDKA